MDFGCMEETDKISPWEFSIYFQNQIQIEQHDFNKQDPRFPLKEFKAQIANNKTISHSYHSKMKNPNRNIPSQTTKLKKFYTQPLENKEDIQREAMNNTVTLKMKKDKQKDRVSLFQIKTVNNTRSAQLNTVYDPSTININSLFKEKVLSQQYTAKKNLDRKGQFSNNKLSTFNYRCFPFMKEIKPHSKNHRLESILKKNMVQNKMGNLQLRRMMKALVLER